MSLSRRIRSIAACAALATSVAVPSTIAGPRTGNLTVEVDLGSRQGPVRFALFDDKAGFGAKGEPVRRGTVEACTATCEWSVVDLPYGRYAAKAYLDVDGSNTLTVNALGIPVEPYGFSNDARGTFGPPKYRKARFELRQENQRISFRLR